MSEVTLKAIEDLLDSKLDEKFEEKLKPMYKTLEAHTTMLEQIITEKKNKDDNTTVAVYRFDRLETWAKKVGEKIGISPEF
jgi:hypothetical protein